MKQCPGCKTFKKADNCRKCAGNYFKIKEIMTRGANDSKKIALIEAVIKEEDKK
jgi:hypothetical protein